MAIMTILLKLAIMAWHNVAINMVIMSVSANNWQNVDSLWKRIGKICIGLKVMATTKYFVKKGPKMADFLCIFGRNLKLMATSLGWWENSVIFFGDSWGMCTTMASY